MCRRKTDVSITFQCSSSKICNKIFVYITYKEIHDKSHLAVKQRLSNEVINWWQKSKMSMTILIVTSFLAFARNLLTHIIFKIVTAQICMNSALFFSEVLWSGLGLSA